MENPQTQLENRFEQIATTIRGRIVRGALKPGDRLPTWDALSREFDVGRPTLMRAMDSLKRDGFIYSSSTRGTFVSDRPPHLCRYGLVFSSHPGATGSHAWNRFWDALVSQAPILAGEGNVELPVFYDVTRDSGSAYERLAEEVRLNRLGGLIVVGTDELLSISSIAQWSVPKVAIFDGHISMPRVYIDHQSFIDKSLDCLIALGRRRVAVLSNRYDQWDGYEQAIAARDLQSKPFWRLATAPEGACNVCRMLFDPDNTVVPDGLVITDDNIVEPALDGLLRSGAPVPDQLQVVVHCNWPWPVPSPFPVQRLGYDVREILRHCLSQFADIQSGQPPRQVHLVPARFEPGH